MGSQKADEHVPRPSITGAKATTNSPIVTSVTNVGPLEALVSTGRSPPESDMAAATSKTAATHAAITVEGLIRDHHAALYRYAYRLCGSATDAEDIVQQAFMTVCRKLDQVREPEHVSAWLYAVLRSSFLKSRRKPQPQSAGNMELDLDQMPERNDAPEFIDQDQLQLALEDLPEEYKLVVLMFYFEHCSYKEIAERLDLPIGTVMSRLARGKARLRSKLWDRELPSSEIAKSDAVRLAERAAKGSSLQRIKTSENVVRETHGLRQRTTDFER